MPCSDKKNAPISDHTPNQIVIPENAARLLHRLASCGHEAFIVGGCVRDRLMGRTPSDWDICTNALPEEIKQCFADLPVIETGIKHGTLTVLAGHQPYEITTYRIDGDYQDGRHPLQVKFTSRLTDDLARRDFTINAMAYSPKSGLIDPFDGRNDLQNKVLRCVGNAEKRLTEDALRIMRGIRFASQLEFSIEEKTKKALMGHRQQLSRISSERIRVEFDKLLCGPGAMAVLAEYREIIAQIIPEARPMFDLDQKNSFHIYTVWDHTLHVIDQIKNTPVLKLCAFFHDIGKPPAMTVTEEGWGHFYKHEHFSREIASSVMKRLKYDNRTREIVTTVVGSHGIVFGPSTKQARRLLGRLGEENLRRLIELEYADVKSQNPIYTKERVHRIRSFSETVDAVLAAEACFSLRDLQVGGGELLALGVPQGPLIGHILKELLELVIEDKLANEKQALLKEAARIYAASAEGPSKNF